MQEATTRPTIMPASEMKPSSSAATTARPSSQNSGRIRWSGARTSPVAPADAVTRRVVASIERPVTTEPIAAKAVMAIVSTVGADRAAIAPSSTRPIR